MLDQSMRHAQNNCRFDKSLLFVLAIRNGHKIEETLLHWDTHFITQSNLHLICVNTHTSSTVKRLSLLKLFTILSGNEASNNQNI